jgi:uncharacterized protein YpuA (DUF1002 family)
MPWGPGRPGARPAVTAREPVAVLGAAALAGLLPAIRAARLSPTQALWTL